jgi:hypothetical protein
MFMHWNGGQKEICDGNSVVWDLLGPIILDCQVTIMSPQRIASAQMLWCVTQAKSASSTGYWTRCFAKQSITVLVLDPASFLPWSIPAMVTPGTKESECVWSVFVNYFSTFSSSYHLFLPRVREMFTRKSTHACMLQQGIHCYSP